MAITGVAGGSKTGATTGGGTGWGSIIAQYGPAALEALSSYSAGRANDRATDAQLDALGDAGQLQYQTALQAMEMARLRDIQTRLDTEQPRYQGYNAMRTIARQLGLPVYDQPFNRTLDAFRPGGGGGFGGGFGGGSRPAGGIPFGSDDNRFRERATSSKDRAISGAQAGAQAGSVFGPWGTVIGGAVGGAAGYFRNDEGGDLAKGSRVYATKSGTFFDANGNVITRVQRPAEGQPPVDIPGLSRNGGRIQLDSSGNVVRPNKQGGGTGTLVSLDSLADRPTEINGIIAKGYQPLPANDEELATLQGGSGGGIGIFPGESQGTGFMQDRAPEPLPEGRYAGFEETPGYQFVLDEGLRARDKMASSRGRYFSGGTGRELERYAQGVASQEYDNYFRRLMDQVTGGNSATQFTSSAGGNATESGIRSLLGGSSDLGNTIIAGGQVRGSGINTNQQIINSGISGIAGSGVFDRLGSIFGGNSGGVTKSNTPSSSGAKSPLSSYNNHGYTADMLRAYGA